MRAARGLLATARRSTRDRGHDLGPWHRRPNDDLGRWNAYCRDCNRIVVVALEPFYGATSYGDASTTHCPPSETETA